ncbi:MAG TPA: 2-phosphosulfolactate phosphatase [Gemmatimonadales bacterium]
MPIDVAFTPADLAGLGVAGRTVFMIDILRASTTICAALVNGARSCIPVGSIEEAMRLAETLERREVLLTGERNGVRIAGFDLGNSPHEMIETVVRGKTLVMTTTNGTEALLATGGAARVYVAAGVNLALAGALASEVLAEADDLLVVCAGRAGDFSLDDAYAAGRLLQAALGRRRPRQGLNDAAQVCLDLARRYGDNWLRPLMAARSGRELVALGFREDVEMAAQEDHFPVLPQLTDRRITPAVVGAPYPPALP